MGIREATVDIDNRVDPKRWWILGLCGLGQLMVVLDLTVINIALPKAQASLGFSNADRQWIVTAYALAFGGLLIVGGRLGDRIGRKRTFIVGMAGFAVASAVGGAAQSFIMLASARAVQGVFAALLAPSTLALLTTTFSEPGERGKAFGIFSAVAGSGSAVGLLLGGVLTTYLSWRWCLYVNDVIAVVGLVGALTLLTSSAPNTRVHLDDPGIVAGVAGLVALVLGFSQAATSGWGSAVTIVALVLAPLLLVAFVLLERRAAHPFLPLDVFANRNRSASYLTILLVVMGLFAVFLFLVYFLEDVAHFSPIKTGVAFLPLTVTVVAGSLATNTKLLPRFGPRWLVAGGAAIGGLCLLYLAQLSVTTSYWSGIFPALTVLGLGLGMLFGCCFNLGTFGATGETAGVASAMVTTGQQVGGSIGTSLLNTIATSIEVVPRVVEVRRWSPA
jgi:EmrB/QacA subfamily drug resistance transporter